MGYHTRYSLKLAPDTSEARAAAIAAIAEETGCDSGMVDAMLYSDTSARWYTHEAEMLVVSASLPEIVFSLHGSGDEDGDRWVKHFKAGGVQRHRQGEWTPPDFDPSAPMDTKAVE